MPRSSPERKPLPRPASQPYSQSGDQLRVFLLTFGPGAEAWEKFGHNAIAITDLSTGESTAYNWGVFNFGQGWTGFTSFAWHFLQGRLMYAMESEPSVDMLEEYRDTSRSILAQELNLTPDQKLELQSRLIANDTDAKRWYLYDYFQKNCATMARDAVDQTVNGRVRAALEAIPTTTTYRWHDRRSTADTLWLYLFLDFALGHPIDRPLSAWQECFLPGELAKHLTVVKVPDANGNLVPLVSDSRLLNEGTFPERSVPPASFVYWIFAVSVCIGLAFAALAWLGQRHDTCSLGLQLLRRPVVPARRCPRNLADLCLVHQPRRRQVERELVPSQSDIVAAGYPDPGGMALAQGRKEGRTCRARTFRIRRRVQDHALGLAIELANHYDRAADSPWRRLGNHPHRQSTARIPPHPSLNTSECRGNDARLRCPATIDADRKTLPTTPKKTRQA